MSKAKAPSQHELISSAFNNNHNKAAAGLYGGMVQRKMVRGDTTDRAVDDDVSLTTDQQNDIFIRGALVKSLERIRDNRNTLELLPDIKQVLEIMIGSILSPKDMAEPTLTYTSLSKAFNDIGSPLLDYVKNHFTSSYKLESKLDEILWDILGYRGSYPIAILPETTVDYLINSNSKITTENMSLLKINQDGTLPSLGYLGNKPTNDKSGSYSIENNVLEFFKHVTGNTQPYTSTLYDDVVKIDVIDNFNTLKIPELKRRISAEARGEVIARERRSVDSSKLKAMRAASSMEAVKVEYNGKDYTKTAEDKADLQKLYPTRSYTATPVLKVLGADSLGRGGFGHPTVIKLPSESVIPVFNPMNPRDHIGYFVMIDPSGFAVRFTDIDNVYKMLQTSSNATNTSNMASYLINQAMIANNPNMNGADVSDKQMSLAQAIPVFQEQVERDLLERLRNGRIGDGYQLGDMESAMLLMISRSLMNKRTQLLFVPVELMCYMAVDYDEYGLGKSLLDDTRLIAAYRTLNQTVNSVASSKNAITKRKVKLKIPPTEKNPAKAVKILMGEYVKGMLAEYPLTNSPIDQVNYFQRAGISFIVEDHPRYPNTETDVDYVDNQYKEIKTDWDDWLKRQHIRSFGFSPELLEGSNGTDFATQTIFANALTARCIRRLSNRVTPNISRFVQVYTKNSSVLYDGLIELVNKNKIGMKDATGRLLDAEAVVNLFIDSIEVKLPPVDTSTIKDQKAALEEYEGILDAALKHFFNEEWLTEDVLAEIGGSNIKSHQEFIKSHFMRKFMLENGMFTDLFDVLAVNRNGDPLIDFEEKYADHLDAIAKSILPFIKRAKMRVGKIEKSISEFTDKLEDKPGESGGDDYGSSGGGDDYGSSDGDDFGGGDEGMGDDDDGMGDEGEGGDGDGADDDLGGDDTEGGDGGDDDTVDENGKDAIV